MNELLSKINKLNLNNNQLFNYINEYTFDDINKNDFKKQTEYILTLDNVSDINYNDHSLNIKTMQGNINVIKMNNVFKLLKTDSIIGTKYRSGLCHEKSIFLSLCLDIDNDLLTGYVYGLSDKDKYLHSVVEFTSKNKKYILDYTMNAIINKDGYDYLMDFEELSRITKSSLQNDFKIFKGFSKLYPIGTKEYLVYRDEIMRDINKNKDIIVGDGKKR